MIQHYTTMYVNPAERTVLMIKPNELKKCGTNGAHTVFILDDSLSMQSVKNETITGFNEFLSAQNAETVVSLFKFDGYSVNNVYFKRNSRDTAKLSVETYDPKGSTNLLDAIGHVIAYVNKDLALRKRKDRETVNIIILTDGEENSSRHYNNEAIKGLVSASEEKNWSYQFLGANIDAYHVGGHFGFSAHNTMQYSTQNMAQTFRAASRMSNDIQDQKLRGVDVTTAYAATAYTEAEKNEANGK